MFQPYQSTVAGLVNLHVMKIQRLSNQYCRVHREMLFCMRIMQTNIRMGLHPGRAHTQTFLRVKVAVPRDQRTMLMVQRTDQPYINRRHNPSGSDVIKRRNEHVNGESCRRTSPPESGATLSWESAPDSLNYFAGLNQLIVSHHWLAHFKPGYLSYRWLNAKLSPCWPTSQPYSLETTEASYATSTTASPSSPDTIYSDERRPLVKLGILNMHLQIQCNL